MSRYYKIVVGAETATPVGAAGPSGNAGATWTNMVGGKADLGAQMVELDIWAVAFDAPVSQARVTIWGPSKRQISQAMDFNGAPIQVFGGMQKGLPLATGAVNDGQAGLLLSGQIFQAFANWQGIAQSLDFVVTTDGGATQSQPANLSFMCKKGQPMGDAIKRTLAIAYPSLKVSVNISANLVFNQDEQSVYQTVQQFAAYVKGVSQDIISDPGYAGVSIILAGGVFSVFDNTMATAAKPKQINIQDLIGQPTWLGPATIQFNTVMRADLQVGSIITLPQIAGLQAVTSAASGSNARIQNTFSGNWTINNMRHVGNSRAPNAQSWITNFQAITNTVPQASLSVANSSS